MDGLSPWNCLISLGRFRCGKMEHVQKSRAKHPAGQVERPNQPIRQVSNFRDLQFMNCCIHEFLRPRFPLISSSVTAMPRLRMARRTRVRRLLPSSAAMTPRRLRTWAGISTCKGTSCSLRRAGGLGGSCGSGTGAATAGDDGSSVCAATVTGGADRSKAPSFLLVMGQPLV